jgi:hypothetical protein
MAVSSANHCWAGFSGLAFVASGAGLRFACGGFPAGPGALAALGDVALAVLVVVVDVAVLVPAGDLAVVVVATGAAVADEDDHAGVTRALLASVRNTGRVATGGTGAGGCAARARVPISFHAGFALLPNADAPGVVVELVRGDAIGMGAITRVRPGIDFGAASSGAGAWPCAGSLIGSAAIRSGDRVFTASSTAPSAWVACASSARV